MNLRLNRRVVIWTSLILCGPALALDATAQRYSQQLSSGNAVSVRDAAESIYQMGYREQAVLDIAAEVLLQGYNSADADAMAWVCRALGNSGNGRYKVAVSQAAASGNRKLERHCGKAADALSGATGAAYVPGSAKTVKASKDGSGETSARKSGGTGVFSAVAIGMSADEAEKLVGPPTTLTTRITGKQFIPFNFRGKDDLRQYGLYKGKGVIVYSKDRYRSQFRVIDVIEDASETGYPDPK